MSVRVNWPTIGKLIWGLFKLGTLVTIPFMVYSCMKQEIDDDKALKDVTVIAEKDAEYTLIDSDSVKMTKNKLIYFFNFDMRHLTVKGKIADYNLDTTYTFDQYTDPTRINDVRERACKIAFNLGNLATTDQTPKDIKTSQQAAKAFTANHCPQPAPGGNG